MLHDTWCHSHHVDLQVVGVTCAIRGTAEFQTTVPKSLPMAAVNARANAPQNVTRMVAR